MITVSFIYQQINLWFILPTIYLIVTQVGGQWAMLSGTYSSVPTFAGMVSLINAKRIANGYPVVGWLNPAIYKYVI